MIKYFFYALFVTLVSSCTSWIGMATGPGGGGGGGGSSWSSHTGGGGGSYGGGSGGGGHK
ncbi:hypothetical protein [Pseudoduganella namucuonensis]|uniref:Uncharacterized protein n=1 Tax=Pseudoduganella namucuonensis TaxID=1035707 RepID=A0A1I7G9D1_9BURK|nr:hypothetical protein [Pseudoduganella namucuonensis]SFU44951.1 hypothetical protein SAMN05216552_1003154 [Pseudoduganella namucuonensis]